MPLHEGATFAGFGIVALLGSGGMGEVYLVQHPRLPRLQALRILPATLSADGEFRARFQREADSAASLSHPHIVGVHDRGESAGRLWISMGYVEGTNAAQLLRDHYPQGMPLAQAVEIVDAIAGARTTPTATVCCIATSNRATSCCPIPVPCTVESCWRTWESPAGSTTSAG
jgi:serine/threonine-protein kinase